MAQIGSARSNELFFDHLFFLLRFQSVSFSTSMESRDIFSTFLCAMKAMCLASCLIEQTINLLNNYINIYSNNNDDFSTEKLVTFSYILCYFVNA